MNFFLVASSLPTPWAKRTYPRMMHISGAF